jgi:hypothetical protein
MSVAIGSGTTTERQARWVMLAILFIALLANHAFGETTQPNRKQPRQPKTSVIRVCRTRDGVPVCVQTGVFPTNPNWVRILVR